MKTPPSYGPGPKFKVMRDCCTSGNCIECMHLPFGKKLRVSQMGDKPLAKELAERVARGWAGYNAKIEPFDEGRA